MYFLFQFKNRKNEKTKKNEKTSKIKWHCVYYFKKFLKEEFYARWQIILNFRKPIFCYRNRGVLFSKIFGLIQISGPSYDWLLDSEHNVSKRHDVRNTHSFGVHIGT